MGLLSELSQEFEASIIREAGDLDPSYFLAKTAAKDRLGRNKVNKALEKAKKEYSNHKGNLDHLESQNAKLVVQLDNTRKLTNEARKRVITLHKAMQNMDLANASDAVFYNDDSSDIGYIIDGKEFHLEMDLEGEMKLVPMRHYRSEKKKSLQSIDSFEEPIEDLDEDEKSLEEVEEEIKEPEEEKKEEEQDEEEDHLLSDDEINSLFHSLI